MFSLQLLTKTIAFLLLGPYMATSMPTDPTVDVKRDGGPCETSRFLVGDGSPVQHLLHRQVTEPQQCAGQPAGCGVSFQNGKSTSYAWNVGLSGTEGYGWINGGFSVTKTFTEGSSHSCPADNDAVAVWHAMAYTSYQVRTVYSGSCLDMDTAPYTIYSPNENNRDSPGFYCVRGDAVRNEGDQYWENNIRSGGP
ncbi:hypothetical protein GGR54DRAFT_606024 [Hypoxylon sp. NC1633]|nr:hypothetical protein GGR54DRAFT_606024 [Hypoxylon sp. NC1633]